MLNAGSNPGSDPPPLTCVTMHQRSNLSVFQLPIHKAGIHELGSQTSVELLGSADSQEGLGDIAMQLRPLPPTLTPICGCRSSDSQCRTAYFDANIFLGQSFFITGVCPVKYALHENMVCHGGLQI